MQNGQLLKVTKLLASQQRAVRQKAFPDTKRKRKQTKPRQFAICLSVCHFVLVFSVLFIIAITSLGEERANLSVFRTFVWFMLVWICRFPLPLGVLEGLWFVIVALPRLFCYLVLKQFYGQPTLPCVPM